ncbi:MAG: ornithine cyclodeaminase family protein [Azospirillaceae bacterium]
MRVIGAADIEGALDYGSLVERLRQAFRGGIATPLPQSHTIPTFTDHPGALCLATAWQAGRRLGVRIETDFPDNTAQKLPATMSTYMLMDARTGRPLALIDGPALTARRTAAASALAASYLARSDAERLLVLGTGALVPHLILAHAAVRPIGTVLIWGRDADKASRLAKRLNRRGLKVGATDDLAAAAAGADIVCCATRSREPVLRGAWLSPGVHVDLVGAVTPEAREADDDTILAARLFVDTREGVLAVGGDIRLPVAAGLLREDDIAGDLYELTGGHRAGRRFYEQITLFKSVGTPLEDLAAAQLALERV